MTPQWPCDVYSHRQTSVISRQISDVLANRAQRFLNDAVLVVGVGTDFVLFRRNAEQQNAGDARLLRFARHLHRIVDRKIVLARHRTDFVADVLARTNKDRINHRLRRQSRLANQIPEAFSAPQPAHAIVLEMAFGLEQVFLGGLMRADGADILQRECESKAALHAGANIELTDFEAQAVTVRIIANLCDRPLEK